MSHWRTLLSRGIPKDLVENMNDRSPNFKSMFVPFNQDGSLLRVAYQSNDQIQKAAAALGIAPQAIFGLDAQFQLQGNDRVAFITNLHPAIARLYSVWTSQGAPLPLSYLTTLGSMLAHAQLSAMGRNLGPFNLG